MNVEDIVNNEMEYDPTMPYGYNKKYPDLPLDCGEYDPARAYNIRNIVTKYSSVFESRCDNNTFDPVVLDEENNRFIIDTDNWKIIRNNLLNYVFACDIQKNKEKTEDLQEQVDGIINKETVLTIGVNPSIVFYGVPTNIQIGSNVDTIGKIGENSHSISRSGNILIANSEADVSYSEPITALSDFGYEAKVVINGLEKAESATVRVTKPIYYGSGVNPNYANVQVLEPKLTPAGLYNVTVKNNLDYVFFDFPENMVINSFKVNGFDMPMKIVASSRSGYKCYQSINTYDACILPIVIA